MAKTKDERKVPLCRDCGQRHWPRFGGGCPAPTVRVWRHPVQEGYRESSGWGVNTRDAQVVYIHPVRKSGGLTPPPDAA